MKTPQQINQEIKDQIAMQYPTERLRVRSTVQPNGDRTKYEFGMERPEILPSNHPKVLRMLLQRVEKNTFRKPRTLVQEAAVIIDMASTKLRRAKG
jgi:hypothetical protein